MPALATLARQHQPGTRIVQRAHGVQQVRQALLRRQPARIEKNYRVGGQAELLPNAGALRQQSRALPSKVVVVHRVRRQKEFLLRHTPAAVEVGIAAAEGQESRALAEEPPQDQVPQPGCVLPVGRSCVGGGAHEHRQLALAAGQQGQPHRESEPAVDDHCIVEARMEPGAQFRVEAAGKARLGGKGGPVAEEVAAVTLQHGRVPLEAAEVGVGRRAYADVEKVVHGEVNLRVGRQRAEQSRVVGLGAIDDDRQAIAGRGHGAGR